MSFAVKKILIEEIRLLSTETPGVTWSCPVFYTNGSDIWLVRASVYSCARDPLTTEYLAHYHLAYDQAGFWAVESKYYDFDQRTSEPSLFPQVFLDQVQQWRARVAEQAQVLRRRRSPGGSGGLTGGGGAV
jgi:hypothetical protein